MRWVVLHHTDYPGHPDHYDVMLEADPGGPLRTWRAGRWPAAAGDRLVPIHEHRRVYLTYEGPVSRGRGHVRRVAAGDLGPDGLTLLGVGLRIDDDHRFAGAPVAE